MLLTRTASAVRKIAPTFKTLLMLCKINTHFVCILVMLMFLALYFQGPPDYSRLASPKLSFVRHSIQYADRRRFDNHRIWLTIALFGDYTLKVLICDTAVFTTRDNLVERLFQILHFCQKPNHDSHASFPTKYYHICRRMFA